MADPPGHLLRQRVESFCPSASGPSQTGRVHRFPAQRERDPERLARLERQPKTSGLVVRSLDHVDHADPHGHRSRRVDASQYFRGDLGAACSWNPSPRNDSAARSAR